MSVSILVATFPPFPTLSLSVPQDTPFSTVYDLLANRYPELPPNLALSPNRGCAPALSAPISTLWFSNDEAQMRDESTRLVTLRLVPRLRGGKGGFGSQLRAAGGRMSSQKTSNNDSCRDLSGRRLSTIKEAKRLADYIESEPLRKKAQQEAQRAKLEALEKKLGIVDSASSTDPEPLAGKKHRFDDTEYLEQSRDLVDSVKSAVSVAMLKRKKKAKTSHSPPTDKTSSVIIPASAPAAADIKAPAASATDVVPAVSEPYVLDSAGAASVVGGAAATSVVGLAGA
ncbi:uncharacterized protein FIBRA_00380 [Fibroporia radiculosa]|uniref:Uncharacterized protein n=1 Tax=Fibroporia radiculosa TaxID=599839 RepID=J4GHN3_9APHY|nr:uncharacterized protein FIBRA_00380 [Fibroporia radiculosa]CCL98385.1 predicted protein [Fibroporia radiculosa]